MTEAVTGVDLVQAQLRIAGGESLVELGLTQSQIPAARGFAIQARVNMETLSADGQTRPGGGTLTAFEPPTGPGVRTDTYGYAGLCDQPRVRLAAGEGDRSLVVARLRERGGEFVRAGIGVASGD